MTERGKEIKRVDELVIKQFPTSSVNGKLIPIHKQILDARTQEKQEMTGDEFAQFFGDMVKLHLIPEEREPENHVMDYCESIWHSKYKFLMNKHELRLAFGLNMTGDLGRAKIKLTNYQFFSVDYFTDVLNAYLDIKQATYPKQQEELKKIEAHKPQLPPYDPSVDIMERIILDFKLYHAIERELYKDDFDFNAGIQFTSGMKLEFIYKMFEIKTNVEHIVELREIATRWVLQTLGRKLHGLRGSAGRSVRSDDVLSGGLDESEGAAANFGAIASIVNQSARIRSGKLITDADEGVIQLEVRKLLYIGTLFINKPIADKNESLNDCQFVNHIRSKIHLHSTKSI